MADVFVSYSRSDSELVNQLVERLRERGHGVIMVSHNMADVQAVADIVCVLRLGRNNGVFKVDEVSAEDIVVAITGASDNVVARRAGRGTRAPSAPATSEED